MIATLLLVLSQTISPNFAFAAVVPSPDLPSSQIRMIQDSDVLAKTEEYQSFLNVLFSGQSSNHSSVFERANKDVQMDRSKLTLGPQLLGLGKTFGHAPFFKVGAQDLWALGFVGGVLQIQQQPYFWAGWLVGYPLVVHAILRLSGASIRGFSKVDLEWLLLESTVPAPPTATTPWYSLGNLDQFENLPTMTQAVVSFDLIERLVVTHFSNNQPERYGAQIEKYIFRYAKFFPRAMEGWVIRYLQANPKGLDGEKELFVWQEAFELHLRAHPSYWSSVLQSLYKSVKEKSLEDAVARLDVQLSSSSSLPAFFQLHKQRACEYALQWASDFR